MVILHHVLIKEVFLYMHTSNCFHCIRVFSSAFLLHFYSFQLLSVVVYYCKHVGALLNTALNNGSLRPKGVIPGSCCCLKQA